MKKIVICCLLFKAFSMQGAVQHPDIERLNLAILKNSIKDVHAILNDNFYLLNAPIFMGRSPLIQAAICNRSEIIEYLLMRGADINAQDNEGKSAIFHARDDIVALLLRYNPDLTKRNNQGKTVLEVNEAELKDCYARMIYQPDLWDPTVLEKKVKLLQDKLTSK